jgi:hypothetical protein
MSRHLLTCSCGKSIPIEVSQAGETIRCDCGAELDVPSFREIRKLPVAVESRTTKGSQQPSGWSLLRSLLFAIGLAASVFGLCAAGYFQWGRMRLPVAQTPNRLLDANLEEIDQIDPISAVDFWRQIQEFGVGGYNPPPYIVNRAWSARWLQFVYIGLGVAAVGALILGVAYLIPQPAPRRPRRPAPRP